MINPTIGRVVLVWRPNTGSDQPEPALVSHVWSDRLINVGGFDRNGMPFAATSVQLLQDEDTAVAPIYATWMPYQLGQAARAEAAEQAAGLNIAAQARAAGPEVKY